MGLQGLLVITAFNHRNLLSGLAHFLSGHKRLQGPGMVRPAGYQSARRTLRRRIRVEPGRPGATCKNWRQMTRDLFVDGPGGCQLPISPTANSVLSAGADQPVSAEGAWFTASCRVTWPPIPQQRALQRCRPSTVP